MREFPRWQPLFDTVPPTKSQKFSQLVGYLRNNHCYPKKLPKGGFTGISPSLMLKICKKLNTYKLLTEKTVYQCIKLFHCHPGSLIELEDFDKALSDFYYYGVLKLTEAVLEKLLVLANGQRSTQLFRLLYAQPEFTIESVFKRVYYRREHSQQLITAIQVGFGWSEFTSPSRSPRLNHSQILLLEVFFAHPTNSLSIATDYHELVTNKSPGTQYFLPSLADVTHELPMPRDEKSCDALVQTLDGIDKPFARYLLGKILASQMWSDPTYFVTDETLAVRAKELLSSIPENSPWSAKANLCLLNLGMQFNDGSLRNLANNLRHARHAGEKGEFFFANLSLYNQRERFFNQHNKDDFLQHEFDLRYGLIPAPK